jgi:enterochelin esterase-like enzyme
VLYLFHGRDNAADQWVRVGAPVAADKLIAQGAILPMIIVMPHDRMEKNFDQSVVSDVVPFIDANFRTLTDRDHRAIGGLSHGGGWAFHIGLQHADLFSRIGGHSPDVFVNDLQNLAVWARQLGDQRMAISIDIGRDDSMVVCCASGLDELLTDAGVAHSYKLYEGGHTESYWASHVSEYLIFYSKGW